MHPLQANSETDLFTSQRTNGVLALFRHCQHELGRPLNAIYHAVTRAARALFDAGISTPPILDPAIYFPDAKRYLERFGAIRAEALALSDGLARIPRFHDLMAAQGELSAHDGRAWRLFVLKAYGVAVPENLARCPSLAALLEQTPDVVSAVISLVDGHKHIPPHRGPFRGILRFHLGLFVPQLLDGRPATVLRVDGVEHRIGDANSLLWDDTYEHELRNESDQLRIALLLDVRRRGMPWGLQLLSRLIVGAVAMLIRLKAIDRMRIA